ncbi:hypothetical protein ACNKHK_03095 [Shigella flexneri]
MVGQTAIIFNRLLGCKIIIRLQAKISLPKKRRAVLMSRCGSFRPFIAGAELVIAEPENTPQPARYAAILCRIWRNDHALCAVDAGGICSSLTPQTAPPVARRWRTGFL